MPAIGTRPTALPPSFPVRVSSSTATSDGVFKEAFKEIPQPVEQHPFGMGGLEFHVM